MFLRIFLNLIVAVSIFAKPETIRIEGATFRPLQVAIPDFRGITPEERRLSASLTQQVRRYLELSGVFNITSSSEAESVIRGQLNLKTNEMRVVVDMAQTSKSYVSSPADLRRLSQKIADDIYRYFTGEAGPFGSKIVATRLVDKGKQVVLMDFDGSNPRQLTHASKLNILPVLSPNDIYFTTYLKQNPDLYAMNLDGKNMRPISTHRGLNIGPSISPDGKYILLTMSKDGNSEIYKMGIDGKNLTRLTNSAGVDTSPSWSPDGKQIAFVSARSGNPQVYLMNADGSNPTRLTFQGKYNQTPRFSPRGDVIVFMGRDERNVFDIFTYDMSTKKISRVTQDQGNNEDPSFSPNGRMIVFTSTRDGGRDLYVSSIDGNFQQRLTRDGKYWTPNWGPST